MPLKHVPNAQRMVLPSGQDEMRLGVQVRVQA
jgi:hypothetical protein